MRTDLPDSVVETSQDLTPDPFVTLYKIKLVDGTEFLLSPKGTRLWQEETYEEIPCHMAGITRNSDSEVHRPKFTFANPAGLFTQEIYEGRLDNAWVSRIRVLSSDLEVGNDFSVKETFRVKRIVSISGDLVVIELRDVLDGHNYKLPARQFLPPEFNHVKLR